MWTDSSNEKLLGPEHETGVCEEDKVPGNHV